LSHKSIISIDVGSSKIKIAVGKFLNSNVSIEKIISIDTPQGSLKDGKIIYDEDKAEILMQIIVQALSENRIKYKDAIFTIQSTSIIRREVEVPKVKPYEMESMIRYEIEQYLPIDLNEYIIEYKVLEEKRDGKSRILIAALPKAIAEDYLNILKSMHLEPKALDINSNAISKLFSIKQQVNHAEYNLDNTVACIDMGCSNIHISILAKGFYQFSRIIPTGGSELTSAIAEALNITLHEAENKKLSEVDLGTLKTDTGAEILNEVISKIVLRWIDEIQRVFQFYKTRNANNNIDEIYLYGGTSNLKGIAEYITNAVNIPVKQIKNLSYIKLGKHVDNMDLEYYLNSIGAIIRK
jgi:type IV pilus assembly protein PilM